MKRTVCAVLALLASAAGCDKKSDAPAATSPTPAMPAEPPPAKPTYGDTTPLWAFAPADATLGVVIADGVGARVVASWAGVMNRVKAKPFARKTVEELEAMKRDMGFDMLDEAAYKAKGIDLSKGMAMFTAANPDKPSLLIFPVGDRDAFRKTIKATTQKVGDRDVDQADELVCVDVAGRYACAPTLEQIDAAMKPHDAPIATAVKALPADSRGDAELYVDATKMPSVKAQFAQLLPLGDFGTMGVALRYQPQAINLVGWAKGPLGPVGTLLVSSPPPADLAGLTADATSVVRAKIDPKLFAMAGTPTSVPGANGTEVPIGDLFTGDMEIVTAGKGILAGAMFFKLVDPAKLKPVVASMCAEIKKGSSLPVSGVVDKDGSCSGAVSLASLKDTIGVELPPFRFNFAVTGDLLAVVLGDLDLAALKGTVADEAGSPETRELLAGATTAMIWSRHIGADTSALPRDLKDKIAAQPNAADGLNMMNWSASQVYDVGAGLTVTPGGVSVIFHATTFDGDPPAARAALDAAFDKRAGGDRPGFLAALDDLEKKFPGTLAGRRAKLERVGTPIVGPILGVAVGGAAATMGFARAATMPTIAPPAGGGGFGEPGAVPAPAPAAPDLQKDAPAP